MGFIDDTKDKAQKATEELKDKGDDVGDDMQDKSNNLQNKFHEQKGEPDEHQDQANWHDDKRWREQG